ncbi:MAG TPA: xanthine dehydrogenase FAD-binding subunit XdhB [Propioniciclava tarda]|nr:xanthine dehydrogenase FAD-binding subunit XdhB [Propioniciclava tarda]HQA30755.1 xanthine dehydrogenase FAD-binding subunit XdhB [Propioniciclava tarda]HQD60124.1 xanthine dehydrogenase FAD-binding subunit XdhB [Propioniciclava tarda]
MFDLKALYIPDTVEEALELLKERPEARVMAGGSDNLVKLRDGHLLGLEWVSIFGLDELRQITLDDDGTIRIGPLANFATVARHEIVRTHIPSLAHAVLTIGGPQVRNIGTIGGNLCNGVPSADSASTCYAWDAQMELRSADGVRVVPIPEFYITAGKVDLRPGELVTGILIRRESYEGCFGAYHKYAMRNAMDIATVNCSTVVKLSADHSTIEEGRIAFGVAAPTPIRAPHGEAELRGKPVSMATVNAAAQAALGDTRARDSWRAGKAFREHMLAEIARRCLVKSITRAGGRLIESSSK